MPPVVDQKVRIMHTGVGPGKDQFGIIIHVNPESRLGVPTYDVSLPWAERDTAFGGYFARIPTLTVTEQQLEVIEPTREFNDAWNQSMRLGNDAALQTWLKGRRPNPPPPGGRRRKTRKTRKLRTRRRKLRRT